MTRADERDERARQKAHAAFVATEQTPAQGRRIEAVRDSAGKLEEARRRGTIYEHDGQWKCTTHGAALTAAFNPNRLACPRDECHTEVPIA